MNNIKIECYQKSRCTNSAEIFLIGADMNLWACCKQHFGQLWEHEKYITKEEYIRLLKLQILK